MPEAKPKLSQLATRKKLLLLESDLNRALFEEALRDWRHELHHSKEQLTQIGSMASTVAKVATTLSTARRLFSRRSANGAKSWLSLLFDGVMTGTSLWRLLHSQRHKRDD